MKLFENPLFESITESDGKKMLSCFEAYERSFAPGQTICSYGSGNSLVGIVLSGDVLIVRIDASGIRCILEKISKNGIFGETLSFFGSNGECVFAVSETQVDVLFIDYRHITKRCANACEHHSILVLNMIKLIAENSLRLSERIEVLSHRSIKEKLRAYFSVLSSYEGSNSFKLPFSLSALSEYLCVDRSAMMRELKNLKESGELTVKDGCVTLLKTDIAV